MRDSSVVFEIIIFKPISFYNYDDNVGNILLVVYNNHLLQIAEYMIQYQPIVSTLTFDLYLS